MPPLDAEGWKDKSVDLANELAKQFIALGLGGIAFAVSISGQDSMALHSRLFWTVIGGLGLSTVLGFVFLMHGVSYMAQGKRLDLYNGAARFVPMLQIVALVGSVVVLLLFHVEAVSRKSGAQETKVTVQQGGKDTLLAVQPGKAVTITVSPVGDLKAEVK